MSTEENKAIVVRHLKEVLEQGRVELIESYYAPQAPNTTFGTSEEWRDLVLWHHKVAPGLKVNILEMIAEGDKVMVYWQAEVTFLSKYASEYDGPFPPLDVPARWMVASLLQIADGKIVSEKIVNEWGGLLFDVVSTSLKKAAANKAIVTRHFKEVVEQGHVDLIPSYFGPDGTTTNLPTMQGMKDAVLWHHKHCPGFTVTLLDLMADGDKVIANIQYDLTYSVPVDPPEIELSPLGKPFRFRNMNVFTIVDGRMVGESPVHGNTDALIAMGAIPSPYKVEENKAAVRKFVDAVNRRDNALLAEICTPEEAKNWIEALPVAYAMWKDHHVELVDLVADGEMVAVKMATSGYHNGEAFGLAPTGKWWTKNGNGLFYFSDGKISKTDFVFDDQNLIKQLGGVIRPAA